MAKKLMTGYVDDIGDDEFYCMAMMVEDGADRCDLYLTVPLDSLNPTERSYLELGAYFDLFEDQGVVFNKEVWTPEEIEAARLAGEKLSTELGDIFKDADKV